MKSVSGNSQKKLLPGNLKKIFRLQPLLVRSTTDEDWILLPRSRVFARCGQLDRSFHTDCDSICSIIPHEPVSMVRVMRYLNVINCHELLLLMLLQSCYCHSLLQQLPVKRAWSLAPSDSKCEFIFFPLTNFNSKQNVLSHSFFFFL